MKKGDIVKIKLLGKDKQEQIVERKIHAISASQTTVQVQDLDGKIKWKPITSIVDDDAEVTIQEPVKEEQVVAPAPVAEKPLAEKAKEVIQEAELLAKKAEKMPKVPGQVLKQEIIKLMKEGKTNKEIRELIPQATAGYIGPIRSAYFEWTEPTEGTVKRKIIDLHRAGKTVEEIVELTGSSLGHVKFQVNTYKRFHDK